MALLACIPVTGCLTLAEVAACSLTTADQTFALDAGTQVIFEQADGDNIFVLDEANSHGALGPSAVVDNAYIFDPSTIYKGTLFIQEEFTGDYATAEIAAGLFTHFMVNPSEDVPDQGYYAVEGKSRVKSGNIREIGTVVGFNGQAAHAGSGLVYFMSGLQYTAYNLSDGDIDDLMGISVVARNLGTGAVGNAYGIWIFGQTGGTVSNNYGIKIENMNVSGANNHAILTNAGNVIFNEGSHDDTDFRVEGATDANLLMVDGSADTVQVGAATASDSAKFYVSGKISASGEVEINGALNHDGTELGVFATAPTTQKTVTGSRGGNAALASLLTQLAAYGLIIDSSTA